MAIARRWKFVAAALAGLLALLLLAAARWLPTDEALAARVAMAASQALGVEVTVASVRWQLLPTPRVVVRDAATAQAQPLRLAHLQVEPRLWPLLAGRVELNRVVLDGGTIVQRSLKALGGSAKAAPASPRGMALELARVEVRNLTWISRSGVAVVVEGEADFDQGMRLRTATLRRPGARSPTDIVITREEGGEAGAGQRFALKARLGGGVANGHALVQAAADESLQLSGALSPRGVEIQAALAAFNRDSPVSGDVNGETTLAARGPNALALVQTLRTETRFVMQPAEMLRFDLDRAIETLGREHRGRTRLDRIEGRVETQNGPDGMAFHFADVKASSGSLSASGDARLLNRYLQGRAAVDLVGGVVGVPMRIEGQLGALKVTVSKAPLVGAAIGTAVLPGVGTAIGAAVGRMLSGDEGAPEKPRRPAR